MSDVRVVESDPTGKSVLLYVEHADGSAQLVEQEDVTALVEANKRLQAGPPTISKTGEIEMIARIPPAIHARLKKLGIIRSPHEDPWQRRLLKWIKEHPKFKTSTRRVI